MKKKTQIKPNSEKRVYLQVRDMEVMRTLAKYGLLRLSTLHALCFRGLKHQENVQGKLKRLIDKGYLVRHSPDVRRLTAEEAKDKKRVQFEKHRREQVYCLDKRGAQEIGIEKFDPRFKKMITGVDVKTPHHRLDIADVRACVELACREDNDIELVDWWDEYDKYEDGEYIIRMETKNGVKFIDPDTGKERTLPLCPDGCFILKNSKIGKQDLFYLEIDEGTEFGRKRWPDKIIAYQVFAQVGFKQQFPNFKESGFRVLTVNRSDTGKQQLKRTEGLIDKTLKAKGKKRFWFCSFDTIMPEECVSVEHVFDSSIWYRATPDELETLKKRGQGLRLADFLFDKDLKQRV